MYSISFSLFYDYRANNLREFHGISSENVPFRVGIVFVALVEEVI